MLGKIGTGATVSTSRTSSTRAAPILAAVLAANGGTLGDGVPSRGLSGVTPASRPLTRRLPELHGSGTVARSSAAPAAVPEPTTVASFGFGGFGLLGLMVRARKARKTVA